MRSDNYNETITLIHSKKSIIIFNLFIYLYTYVFLFVFDICYCKIFDLFLIFSFFVIPAIILYIFLLVLYCNCIFLIVSKFVNNFMAKYTYLPTYLPAYEHFYAFNYRLWLRPIVFDFYYFTIIDFIFDHSYHKRKCLCCKILYNSKVNRKWKKKKRNASF